MDQSALRAARRAGLETGGWAEKSWTTERGIEHWLKDYGLRPCPMPGYPARTAANVRDSDATVYIHDDSEESPGRIATRRSCSVHDRPFMVFRLNVQGHASKPPSDDARAILDFISQYEVVNVAGNRESSSPGIGVAAEEILGIVFGRLAAHRA